MHNPAESSLPRRLGLLSAAAILIGSVIGSGIFRSPAGIADKLPGPIPMLAVWVVGGLFALCGALTLAEIASAFPQTGGMYVYIREGWGRMAGFLFGWAQIAMVRAAALGAIGITFAEYLFRVFRFDMTADGSARLVQLTAVGAILLTASFNYTGVKNGSLVQNITTLAKFSGLVFIILIALAMGLPRTGGHFTPGNPPGSFSIAPFGLALVSVLWAFDGWADLSFVGGEVKDPSRNLPRALILGTVTVIVVYLLANIAYLSVLDIETIRGAPLVAAEAAEVILGPVAVVFVSATVMISTFGTLNGSILTGPRIFFAVAEDRLFPGAIAKVHPKFETPYVAIALSAALGVVYTLALGSFSSLADAFVTAMVPFYGLAVSAIFFLRRRPDYKPSFRVPLYPLIPIVFILATIFLLVNALIDEASRNLTAAVLGGILVGIPIYFIAEKKR